MPKWVEFFFLIPLLIIEFTTVAILFYLDRNHAGILIIWDKLFGTFQPELESEKVKYGLVVNIKNV